MTVHIEHQGKGVYTATLDNPSTRNALNGSMFEALSRFLQETPAQPDARVLLIKGAGGFFCSGRDMGDIKPAEHTSAELMAPILKLADAFRQCPLPVLVLVRGKAVGLGMALACWADIVIATDDASFSLPEARAGITPSITAVSAAEAIGQRQALDLCLTGRSIDATTSLNMGLVHYVCTAEQSGACLDSVIEHIRKGGPQALRLTKALFRKAEGMTFDHAIDAAVAISAEALGNPEVAQGLRAFKEKQAPEWYA